jgi:hypothetical protein
VRVDTIERAQANRLVVAAPATGFLHPVVTATSVSRVSTTSSARFADVCVKRNAREQRSRLLLFLAAPERARRTGRKRKSKSALRGHHGQRN